MFQVIAMRQIYYYGFDTQYTSPAPSQNGEASATRPLPSPPQAPRGTAASPRQRLRATLGPARSL